jgi:developmental checkpoint coupling sporulation initiation to replication initiation
MKVNLMRLISDETLIESYYKALDLQLEMDFVDLLLAEIRRRKIKLELMINSNEASVHLAAMNPATEQVLL